MRGQLQLHSLNVHTALHELKEFFNVDEPVSVLGKLIEGGGEEEALAQRRPHELRTLEEVLVVHVGLGAQSIVQRRDFLVCGQAVQQARPHAGRQLLRELRPQESPRLVASALVDCVACI